MAAPPKTETPPAPGATSSPPPPPPIEYAYMYEKDKSPSKLLDALLRSISRHIILEIGDKNVCHLTPEKLAAFYKAVGGDYDSLFEMPHESISYIWQVTGCQHTMQPTANDFEPPSIPALTSRGFSRWESLEILLGPEEHVPFLQFAVKNWQLKHPETGQEFPPELPPTVFPSQPDAEVDRWHKSCAEKLRKEANAREREAFREAAREPTGPGEPGDGPEPKFAYSHVRGSAFAGNRARPASERPLYNHVPGRHAGPRPTRPSPERYNSRSDEHARRRSFSDYNQPPSPDVPPHPARGPSDTYLDPNTKRPAPPRRHSQPRHYSSESSDDEPVPPRARKRSDVSPPSPTSRRYSPSNERPPPVASNPPPSFRPHRADVRPDESGRRRSTHSPSLREKLSEKVSNILPNGLGNNGQDRNRNAPRTASYNTDSSRGRRSRDRLPPSRLSRSYSDISAESSEAESSDEEFHRNRRIREDRDRERDRERERERIRDRGRQRELDREREEERRERYLRRPDMERRTSSHADAERRRDYPGWDPRSERKRWDKRLPPDERGTSPLAGSGRRYAEPAYP